MDLFKNYVRQSVHLLNEQAGSFARIYFEDFGGLEFEKYLTLRDGRMTKRTWSFRVDFKSAQKAARYLYFFGFPSYAMSESLQAGDRVTLHVATEISPFLYERLDNLQREDLPDIREVAYSAGEEQFVVRTAKGVIQKQRVEEIVRLFFEQVIQRNF
jgi:hypothetical protein